MILEQLATKAQETGLPFLLIGGHAVNFHGYSRFTKDIDFLINRDLLPRWSDLLKNQGYSVAHTGATFCQFQNADSNLPGVDLMLVNEQTFQKLMAKAKIEKKDNFSIPLVCAEHLVALKLHALKQDLEHRRLKDFLDIVEIVRAGGIDLQSAEMAKSLLGMERKTSTAESNLQLNESSVWDLELPVLPPEFGEAPRLSFSEHLRFCDEMLRFNRRYGLSVQPGGTPVSEEFVL